MKKSTKTSTKTSTKKSTATTKPCDPEWVVKGIQYNTSMLTISWSAPVLEALVQKHTLAPGQAMVFVNSAYNRVRVVVRANMELVYLIMCPVDTNAVIWNSPQQVLLFFTRWLYTTHGSKWSALELAALIEKLAAGDTWNTATKGSGEHRRSTRKKSAKGAKGMKNTVGVSGVGPAIIHQTVIQNRVS